MDKFTQALQHLLPEGYAWPRDPRSVLMAVLSGVAAPFNELEAVTLRFTQEWKPQITTTRLAEWESAVGLPDACFGPEQTIQARRGRLLSRLRGGAAFYPDSSPGSVSAIEAICENLGYPAKARYNVPMRCGRDRAGRRLGRLDGRLFIAVRAPSTPLRCGEGRVGTRLVTRPAGAIELACYLDKYIAARFQINVVFED